MHLTTEQISTFLIGISIMLFVAKAFGELFIKIKQPPVIGEIIAGIILGPTIFGMFWPTAFEWLFTTNNEVNIAIEGITNIGVVLLLLVSGLEVDLSIVLQHRKAAIYISIIGIIIPFFLGFLITYIFPDLMGLIEVENKIVFALFIGTAIAISSLPVIAKILMDLKIFRTQLGFIIIAAAMLNDLIGWFIFSIILGMIGANSHSLTFAETLFYTILFIIVILFFGRILIDKIIVLIQSKLSYPGSILNFILILGFLGAAFTEFLGIHAILGAFIIGIAIGDSTNLNERTRETINQFITNIFAPLFFVSIGMKVHFINDFNFGIVVTILALAFVGKVVGCSLGARLAGLSKSDSLAVGSGMSSSGAMGIIIGLIALEFKLINEEVFVGLVIMALFTSIVSAPLMNYFLKTRKKISFTELISKKNIFYSEEDDKLKIIEELSTLAAGELKIDKKLIFREILNREGIHPTGIANYLAIPHAKVSISNPFIGIAIAKKGVNFEAFDKLPSKIIVLLLTPLGDYELQLRLLSEIASKFKDRKKVEKLLFSENKTEFVSMVKKLS